MKRKTIRKIRRLQKNKIEDKRNLKVKDNGEKTNKQTILVER